MSSSTDKTRQEGANVGDRSGTGARTRSGLAMLTVLLVVGRHPLACAPCGSYDPGLAIEQFLWLVADAAPQQTTERAMDLAVRRQVTFVSRAVVEHINPWSRRDSYTDCVVNEEFFVEECDEEVEHVEDLCADPARPVALRHALEHAEHVVLEQVLEARTGLTVGTSEMTGEGWDSQ